MVERDYLEREREREEEVGRLLPLLAVDAGRGPDRSPEFRHDESLSTPEESRRRPVAAPRLGAKEMRGCQACERVDSISGEPA